MRKNLFIGTSNEQLKECYESYVRVQCKRENKRELFNEVQSGYIDMLDDDTKKKEMVAFCIARDDMFHTIAKRFFDVYESFGAVTKGLS